MRARRATTAIGAWLATAAGCGPQVAIGDEGAAATSSPSRDDDGDTGLTDPGDTADATSAATPSDGSSGAGMETGMETGEPFGTWGEPTVLAQLETTGGFHAGAMVVAEPWVFAATDPFAEPMLWRVETSGAGVESMTWSTDALFATSAFVYGTCSSLICTRVSIDAFTSSTIGGGQIVGVTTAGVVRLLDDLTTQALSWQGDDAEEAELVFSSDDLTRILGVGPSAAVAIVGGDLVRIDLPGGDAIALGASPIDPDDAGPSAVTEATAYVSTLSGIVALDLQAGGAVPIDGSGPANVLAANPDRVAWADALELTRVYAADANGLALEEVAAADAPIVALALGDDALYWLDTDGRLVRIDPPA